MRMSGACVPFRQLQISIGIRYVLNRFINVVIPTCVSQIHAIVLSCPRPHLVPTLLVQLLLCWLHYLGVLLQVHVQLRKLSIDPLQRSLDPCVDRTVGSLTHSCIGSGLQTASFILLSCLCLRVQIYLREYLGLVVAVVPDPYVVLALSHHVLLLTGDLLLERVLVQEVFGLGWQKDTVVHLLVIHRMTPATQVVNLIILIR